MSGMWRAIDALREWIQLRARFRDEHQFHLERAAADFRALGLSSNAANRAARGRFGSRENSRLALRELGGDCAGLIRLALAHRVDASPWFPPAVLIMATMPIILLSPAPRAAIEGIVGEPLAAADRGELFISEQARNLSYVGITKADFESLQSLAVVTNVERYLSIHAQARAVNGVTFAAIDSQVRAKTSNPRLRVVPMFERQAIVMGPAKAVWGFISFCSLLFVATFKSSRRWLSYGLAVACLHSLASLIIWALAIQLWSRIAWSTDGTALLGFLALSMAYLGVVALQCHLWWRDLRRRCPLCLDSLLLTLTKGTADCYLLNSVTTESVCAHGHGVLVENRWSCGFRPERSSLQRLVHG
jgi:hypothetical protein